VSGTQGERVWTTGSFTVTQFDFRQKSFVLYGNVPVLTARLLNNYLSLSRSGKSEQSDELKKECFTIEMCAYFIV